MTYRDANAATMADFLDPRRPHFLEPPTLSRPGGLLAGEAGCSTENPNLPIRH
jgi:hypothetical protein